MIVFNKDPVSLILDKRKSQLEKFYDAKRAGKITYFVINRLVIKRKPRQENSYANYFVSMCDNILTFSYLDDNEFATVTYEFQVGPVPFDFDRLSKLFINLLSSILSVS